MKSALRKPLTAGIIIAAFLLLPAFPGARAEDAVMLEPPLIAGSDAALSDANDYYAQHPEDDPVFSSDGQQEQSVPEKSFVSPTLLSVSDYSYVRVLLSTSGGSLNVVLNGCYSLRDGAGATRAFPAYGSVYTFSASGNAVYVYCGGVQLAGGSELTVYEHRPFAGTNGNAFSLANSAYGTRSYKGSLTVYAENGSLKCVNRVHIEEYLCGVVGNEIGDSSPAESLKAQAVAARSYAVKNISSSGRYDLLDTSSSQVYKGICSSDVNSAAAVAATSKQLIMSGQSVVLGLYSSSNGGEKDTSRNRWGGNPAWSGEAVMLDTPDLIYSQSYALRNNSTSYYEEAVFPINGSKTADTTALITHSLLPRLISGGYCAASATASNVTLNGISMTYTPTTKTDAVSYLAYLNVRYMGYVNGNYFDVTDNIYYTSFYVSNGWGLFSNGNLNQYWITTDGSSYILRHARRGHGIGLSQIGARQWALSGASYTSILQFYYDGAQPVQSALIRDKALTLRGLSLPQGDVYIDNSINIQDVILLCKYIAGTATLDPTQMNNADTNQDGKVSLADAVVICRYIAGLL